MLDCCFSGAAAQGFRGAALDQLQQLNQNACGTYLVTSSTKNQVSMENAKESYGLFTKYLISGLKTGEANKSNTGWISMNDWFDYVQSRVVAENPRQQPTKHVNDERGGGLMIAKSGRDSRKERAKKFKPYFLDLAKEELIEHEMLSEILRIIDMSVNELSKMDAQKDSLLGELYNTKKVARFMEHWYSLRGEKEPFIFSIFQVIGVLLLVIIGGIAGVIYALSGDKSAIPPTDIVVTASKLPPVVTDNSQAEMAALKAKQASEA